MDLAMAQCLVDRRKAAGLSQEALAAQLGVSRQAVSKWERSESSPDTDNLIALAALYGVSLDELLYGEAAGDVETSTDDDLDANNSDEVEGTETSTEHTNCGDKPLVDISLAHGIHVIDPEKGEEVHVGWNGIMETPQTSLSRSNPSAMLGQRRTPLPSCGEIRTVEDLGASNSPYFTATHEWGGQFQHGNWHLTHCMPRKGRFTTMNSMRPTTSIFFKNRQAFYLRFYCHPFRHGRRHSNHRSN